MASAPHSLAMNESKTCRSPHKDTDSHRKNKYLFQILPAPLCCSRWILRDRKATERKLHETQVKNLWFYYVLSCITISHGIAVKWFLRVYWLLPRSIVASFKKHRRFFCLAPSILLLSTDDSFAEHHEYLGQLVNFFLKRYLLSCKMESVRMIDSLLIFTHGYWKRVWFFTFE